MRRDKECPFNDVTRFGSVWKRVSGTKECFFSAEGRSEYSERYWGGGGGGGGGGRGRGE